jgi:hypothetical protein
MDPDTALFNELKSMDTSVGTYNVMISPHIHERIERHVLVLKRLVDRSTTKQRWVAHAIKEKLAKDADNQMIPKETRLNVKIDEELDRQVLQRIEFIKKFRSSYSKKQWIMDAIFEKLERDEAETKKKMLEAQQSRSETHKQVDQLLSELEAIKAQLSKGSFN